MGLFKSKKKKEEPKKDAPKSEGEPKEEAPAKPIKQEEKKGKGKQAEKEVVEEMTWESFTTAQSTPEEKLLYLKGNSKLLFSDHKSLQSHENLWMALIPEDWRSKILEEYDENVAKMDEIVHSPLIQDVFLRPMLVSKIENDVDDFISTWKYNGQTKNVEAKKIVKVFAFSRKDLVYDTAFSHFASFLAQSFNEDNAYLFLVYLVKFLFPKDFFNPAGYFLAQKVEFGVLAKVLDGFNPTMKKMMTTTAKQRVREEGSEGEAEEEEGEQQEEEKKEEENKEEEKKEEEKEEVKKEAPKINAEASLDCSAYRGFIHHLGRVYMTQLCSTMISKESFMKLIDLLMVYGFQLIHHFTLKCILKCDSKILHNMKCILKGKSLSPQNLKFAAICASCEIKVPLSHGLFLQALEQALTHKPYADALRKYETFAASAKLEEGVDINEIVEKRIWDYSDALDFLFEHNMEMDEERLEDLLKFLRTCKSKDRSLNGQLDYETFKLKMENKWTFDPLVAFLITSDPWNTGFVNYYSFELNLTLLSKIDLKQKYSKWCNFYFASETPNYEFSDVAQMFTTWDYYLLGIAVSGNDRGLEKVLENKYPEQSNVTCSDIVEFVSNSCSDMKPFCELTKAVSNHIASQEMNYEKGDSVNVSTPNVSFTKNLADKFPGPNTKDILFEPENGFVSKITRSCQKCVIF